MAEGSNEKGGPGLIPYLGLALLALTGSDGGSGEGGV
jgi:hypothetical protein